MTSRILIVEDDPSIRLGLKRSLEFEGFTVDLARDGEEAHQQGCRGAAQNGATRGDEHSCKLTMQT